MSSGTMKVLSSDEQEFTIDYDIAKQSKILKLWFDGECAWKFFQSFHSCQMIDDMDEPIRLSHINSSTLKSVS
jgi:hypothetical protein